MKKNLVCLVLIATISLCCQSMGPSQNANTNSSNVSTSSRETGRAFLTRGENETPGYGLYSYLLFGTPPTPATRERYIKAITAYLDIPKISELSQYRPTCELNVTYLPLTESAPGTPLAEWVLEHYDFARARIFLQTLAGGHRNGPYIISTYKPLSGLKKLSGQYLYQDLSSTPPKIVSSWVKEFLNQAEQERFWEERTAMQCVLRLRQAVEIAAEGLPDVQKSLSTVIAWVK